MSEQAEGQRLDNTVSRRKIVRLGAIGGIAALAKGILSDAKPASAAIPTPVSTPSPVRTPTVTPSVKELQTKTAKLFVEQTAQAEQIEEAVKYKNAAATNTAQAKKLEEAFDTRPSTSTPTPTKPPAATPTVTPTFTADQIEIKRRAGLLPPEPTATDSNAERATPVPPPPPPPTSGRIPLVEIGLAALAIVGGVLITKPWRIVKRVRDSFHRGADEGTGDTTPH